MTAFWALRVHPPATALPPPPAVPEPPEEPRDCVVILTFPVDRRQLASATLMTAAEAEAEAAMWRKLRPQPMHPGPSGAEVCRLVRVP